MPVADRPAPAACPDAALKPSTIDFAVIGAGPYGLSIAAHLRGLGRTLRVFGSAPGRRRGPMPESDGCAWSLYAPPPGFTLAQFCAQRGLDYQDGGRPVPVDTLVDYGLAFQRRYVPGLEDQRIESLRQERAWFELRTAAGELVHARRVIVATGPDGALPAPPPGPGWRARLCTEAPLVFHALPQRLRLHLVARHLGRASAEGSTREGAVAAPVTPGVERPALSRLAFVDDALRARLRSVDDTPILDRGFQSSVPGLHFAGPIAANSFGPLLHLACGASFTARRLARQFAAA